MKTDEESETTRMARERDNLKRALHNTRMIALAYLDSCCMPQTRVRAMECAARIRAITEGDDVA